MDAPYDLTTGLPEQVSFRGLNVGNDVSRFVAAVAAWFARHHRIDRITRTLNQRSDRQLADMGLTRDDIPAVARGLPVPPRHEYDGSARPTVKPVSILPIALMR